VGKSLMISNIDTYLAMARDALATSKQLETSHRRPKANSSQGAIITYDPTHASFKHSLIAIVFAGVYLDALLYIVGTQRLGLAAYEKIERKHYEVKLQALGITDQDTIAACKRFREARNDIVHEKARQPVPDRVGKLHVAQHEAEHALSFVARVSGVLCAAT
jgi:hypothetical protein